MAVDDTAIANLESQVDDMLKQLDDVLKTHASPGAPESEAESELNDGSGAANTAGHMRRPRLHDNKATSSMDKSSNGQFAKRGMMDEEDMEDGGDDEAYEDDSNPSQSKKTKKAAPMLIEKDESEALVIDGERITKNQVGDAQFAILKGLNERLSKAQERIDKAEAEAEMVKLCKRADEDYAHVPGSTDERAQMLKAMNSMPEQLRKSFEKVFEQSQKLAKQFFEKKGFGAADIEGLQKSGQMFESKVSEIKKRDNCSRTEALEKARKEDPEGFKAYQARQ